MKSFFIIVSFAILVIAIGIYLLKGPSVKEMPDVTGHTVKEAFEMLESFTPGEIRIVPPQSEGSVNATVKGQEPAPGDQWICGNEIVLHVSRPVVREFNLEPLLTELGEKIKNSPYADSEVIVVSGTLMGKNENVHFSQLELGVIEDLREHLAREGIQVAEISREDWIFLKIPELGIPPICQNDNKVLVLEVNLNPSESAQEGRIRVWGYTFSDNQRENTDIVASVALDYSDNSEAKRLYEEKPAYLPIPKGTKENPYEDIDELARVLVSEAVGAYPVGTNVAIDVKAIGAVSEKIISQLQDATTHWLDDYVSIVAGYEDFRRLVERLDFEKTHDEFHFTEVEPFRRADIYILVDIMDLEDSVFRASMRAFWLKGGTKVRGLKAMSFARYGRFSVSAKLNKKVFKSGDSAYIEVQPVGRSCFVWVFNFTADGKIMLLFPYNENDKNFFLYGEILNIPSKENDYELKIYAEHAVDKEEMRVVAVKHEVDFPHIETESPQGHVISRKDYERWLCSIPEKDRAVHRLEYLVER